MILNLLQAILWDSILHHHRVDLWHRQPPVAIVVVEEILIVVDVDVAAFAVVVVHILVTSSSVYRTDKPRLRQSPLRGFLL